jgi:hypothetical protein
VYRRYPRFRRWSYEKVNHGLRTTNRESAASNRSLSGRENMAALGKEVTIH